MRVGFTGTQRGMTPAQEQAVARLLSEWKPVRVHHGDCIGADAQFHELCKRLEIPVCIHPPILNDKRAFCKGDLEMAPKDYLARNHDIVDICHRLIATPRTVAEALRSGTWATIRYARKNQCPVFIVSPEGDVVQ